MVIYNENIMKILSIILGLLLAYIVKFAVDTRNCIIYKIPNPNKIQRNIYKSNNKCYKLKTEESECKLNI
jgi:hypothetical protein